MTYIALLAALIVLPSCMTSNAGNGSGSASASASPIFAQNQSSAQLAAYQRSATYTNAKKSYYTAVAQNALTAPGTPRGLRAPRQPTMQRYLAAHSRSGLGTGTPQAVYRDQSGVSSFNGFGLAGQYNRASRSIYVGQAAPLGSSAFGNPGAGSPVTYNPYTNTFSFQ